MLCLSYSATLKTVDRTTVDHDSLLVIWRNNLLEHLPVIYLQLFVMHTFDLLFICRNLRVAIVMILVMHQDQQ